MKKQLCLGAVTMIFVCAGCMTTQLTETEKAVRVLRKSDAPANCKEISKVHAPTWGAVTEEGKENILKKETAKLSGNTVTLDKTDENGTMYGTAYQCK